MIDSMRVLLRHRLAASCLVCVVALGFSTQIAAQSSTDKAMAKRLFSGGYVLKQQGNLIAAVVLFENGLTVDPKNALAHFHLAEIYEALGDTKAANVHYTETLTLSPQSAEASRARAKLASNPQGAPPSDPRYPNVTCQASQCLPNDGYTWVDPNSKEDRRVVWIPGKPSSRYSNVVAGPTEGRWRPAPGYTWVDEKLAGDMRVVPLAALSASRVDVNVKLNGDQQVPPVYTAGSGTGTFHVASDGTVSGAITTTGVEGTMAHIHVAAPGQNGPVAIPLTKTGDTYAVPAGAKLNDVLMQSFKEGRLYVNVHSDRYKGGEIRAQLQP